jgi:transcriptional regulator
MANASLLQGTLDLLILRTLALGPLHGVGIADRIAQVTRGTFTVKAGSLFPALHRLESKGVIAGEWGETPAKRRARLYTLTKAGNKELAAQEKSWSRVMVAIQAVLAMR